MNGDEQTTRALAREIGRHSVERLNEGLGRILAESAALLRWLLAVLFVLNAGGFWFRFAFADVIAPERHDAVAVLFGAGALVAVLAALVSMALMIPLARSMRRAIAHWTDVSVSGEPSDEALDHARRVKLTSRLWLGLTALVMLVSLALFLAGAKIASNDLAALDRTLGFLPAAEAAETAPTPEPAGNAAQVANETSPPPSDEATPTPTPTPSPTPASPPAARPSPRAAPSPRPVARPSPKPQPRPTTTPVRQPTPSPTPVRQPVAPSPTPAPLVPLPAPLLPAPAGETP